MSKSVPNHQSSIVECPDYPIPFPPGTNEGVARKAHREWYWSVNDYDTYECPDCGREKEQVVRFDVHHDDVNPLNGHPSNLIGLCRRCHSWRHHDGPTLKGLYLDEWKDGFLSLGSENGEHTD